jgi:hypothetical protein
VSPRVPNLLRRLRARAEEPVGIPEPNLTEIDAQNRAIVERAFPHTMTGVLRLDATVRAVRHCVAREVPGAFAECGVWRGGSVLAMLLTLQELDATDRDVYLYDTFEGMTEPTEHDVRFDGQSASSQLATQDRLESKVWAYASLEDVQAGFETVPYPSERVHFIKGPVEETVPGQLPEQIAILRLDTDWYESTAHELKHMYDRLVPGGVLMLDDYGWWQGSKLATEEFLDRTGEQLLLIRMGSGRVAVKRISCC